MHRTGYSGLCPLQPAGDAGVNPFRIGLFSPTAQSQENFNCPDLETSANQIARAIDPMPHPTLAGCANVARRLGADVYPRRAGAWRHFGDIAALTALLIYASY